MKEVSPRTSWDRVQQYRRWVKFALEEEHATTPRQWWVCCQLTEGSTPFVK